jgi:hypothetical protein
MDPAVPSRRDPGIILGMEVDVEIPPPGAVEESQFPSGCDHAYVDNVGDDNGRIDANGRLTRLQRCLRLANRDEGRGDYSKQRHAENTYGKKTKERGRG